jgi:hypothetical protein
MKRAILMLTAGCFLAVLAGCVCPHGRDGTGLINGSCQNAPENCAACQGGCQGDCDDGCGDPNCERCRKCRAERCRKAQPATGPDCPTVTYPYYTVRGPRDFLARSPRSIGP